MRKLAGEKLEKAVKLVEVAPRLGHELSRIDIGLLERAHVELKPVAEALDPSEDADGVALVEAPVEQLDVVPDARVDAPRRVDELEGEIRGPGARPSALLARNREDLLDEPILGKLGDRNRGSHERSLGPRVGW